MTLPRLKLVSSHGDQTLSRLRFVVRGAADAREADGILAVGLHFTEGRPVVSANLARAYHWSFDTDGLPRSAAGDNQTDLVPNSQTVIPHQASDLFIFAVPPQFHVGYGAFTTAYIDRTLKRVVGAPLRYAASRRQLAFYRDDQTEAAREAIEAEVAEGYGMDQRPGFVLDAKNIVGSFSATPGLRSLLGEIEVATRAFQPLPLEQLEASLDSFFRPMDQTAEVLIASVVSDLVLSTVESAMISQLRTMRWQGLALLGYQFVEDDRPVAVVPPHSPAEQLQRLEAAERALEQPDLFAGQLAWLPTYARTELRIMRVELDEALEMQ
ncbi:MAG TPA: hypothetical protein VLI05_00140 [Candidatus Saccharimonadia bacterium]|nr:hypothetical protein [Candidatus Saccharimonadia bacterium]